MRKSDYEYWQDAIAKAREKHGEVVRVSYKNAHVVMDKSGTVFAYSYAALIGMITKCGIIGTSRQKYRMTTRKHISGFRVAAKDGGEIVMDRTLLENVRHTGTWNPRYKADGFLVDYGR